MFGMNSLFAGYQARLYWFDWQKLSASGHSSYGRYVYERLLDALQQADFSFFTAFDGDILPGVEIPAWGDKDAALVRSIVSRRLQCFGLVAGGIFNADAVDRHFADKSIGYLGATTILANEPSECIKCAFKLQLVPACHIDRNTFTKMSFQYISDEELGKRGFKVVEKRL